MLTKKQLKQFEDILDHLFSATEKAGKLIVQFEKDDPDAIDVLVKHFKPFKREFFERLKRVGTGDLRLDLYWSESDGERTLSDYPRSVQDDMLRGPVEVAVLANDQIRKELKHVREMTTEEVTRSVGKSFDSQAKALQSKIAEKSHSEKISFKADEIGIITYAKGRITWEQIDGERARLPKPDLKTLEGHMRENQVAAARILPAGNGSPMPPGLFV